MRQSNCTQIKKTEIQNIRKTERQKDKKGRLSVKQKDTETDR
jgi:hypothetical protein